MTLDKLKLIIATGFGFGYAPVASGTFGTLVGIPIVFLLGGTHPWMYMAFTVALFYIGVICSDYAEEYFAKSDAGQIVIDEIVGYMVTMLMIPVTLNSLVVGFFVFRFFDIVKPWPARSIDRADIGGKGVMLDDVIAGLYGCILMHLIY